MVAAGSVCGTRGNRALGWHVQRTYGNVRKSCVVAKLSVSTAQAGFVEVVLDANEALLQRGGIQRGTG